MTTQTSSYPCSRCAGTGRLPVFSNVLGGVCFKCKGLKVQAEKPAPPSILWAVLGEDRNTGMRERLYNVRSPSAAGAIRKAPQHVRGCEPGLPRSVQHGGRHREAGGRAGSSVTQPRALGRALGVRVGQSTQQENRACR